MAEKVRLAQSSHIAAIPGDVIGPEVVAAALVVLDIAADRPPHCGVRWAGSTGALKVSTARVR